MDPVTQKVTLSISAAHKKPQPRASRFKEHLDEADKVVATYPPNYHPPSPSSSTTSPSTTSHSDHDQAPRHLSPSPLAPVRSSSFPPALADQKSTGTLLHRILARFAKGKKAPRSDRTPEMNANPRLQTQSDPARVETRDRRARLGVRGLSEGYLYHLPEFSPESTTDARSRSPTVPRREDREDVEHGWEAHAEEQDRSAAGPDLFEGFSGIHCQDHMDDPTLVAKDIEQERYHAAKNPTRFMNHLEQRLGRTGDHRDVSGVLLRRYQLVETYISEAVHHFSDDEMTLTGSWSGAPAGDGVRSF